MLSFPPLLRLALLYAFVVNCHVAASCVDSLPELPPEVQAAKDEIIFLSLANVDTWGEPETQALVEAQAVILEDWFKDNRPANEIELTQRSWLSIYYEDVSILDEIPFFTLDRDNTYQVVRDGFYYNVGKLRLSLFNGVFARFAPLFTSFLKGEYTLIDLANATTCGETKKNVISLTFRDNSIKRSWISQDELLADVVEGIDSGEISDIVIPGPSGVSAELWNRYIDEDLRVSQGGPPGLETLFVLINQDRVS